MADATGLAEKVKRAAVEAVEASKPVSICFGEVVSVSPLRISVEQKMILGEAQLVLTRNVTDHEILVTDSGPRQITVHNGLEAGDTVIIMRQQEGQRFIVLDRTGGAS